MPLPSAVRFSRNERGRARRTRIVPSTLCPRVCAGNTALRKLVAPLTGLPPSCQSHRHRWIQKPAACQAGHPFAAFQQGLDVAPDVGRAAEIDSRLHKFKCDGFCRNRHKVQNRVPKDDGPEELGSLSAFHNYIQVRTLLADGIRTGHSLRIKPEDGSEQGSLPNDDSFGEQVVGGKILIPELGGQTIQVVKTTVPHTKCSFYYDFHIVYQACRRGTFKDRLSFPFSALDHRSRADEGPHMEVSKTKNAKHRLLLGITNVGFWVIVSVIGLWWFTASPPPAVGLRELFLGLMLTTLLQAVFDWFGGAVFVLDSRQGSAGFVSRWVRGTSAHTALLAATGVSLYWSHTWFQSFCPGVVVCSIVLALGRLRVLQLLTGAGARMDAIGDTMCWSVASKDPSFTGGIHGIGRSAAIVTPESWGGALTVAQRDTVRTRRLLEMDLGLPGRAFIAATVWNLFGCIAGSHLFEIRILTTEHALLVHSLWMTVWGFLGLLLLPSASRGAVFFLDQAAAIKGCDVAGWIQKFPVITGENGSSKTLVQRVFYPVPSVAERLHRLTQHNTRPFFGNVARSNLYLSISTLTILGRCVHCNVGRPELWIFAPSD